LSILRHRSCVVDPASSILRRRSCAIDPAPSILRRSPRLGKAGGAH